MRRGIAVLSAYRELLHPRHGRAALALWGHKVARFTSPFALLAGARRERRGRALERARRGALRAPSSSLYALGGLALGYRPCARLAPARLAGFFMLVNASMLVAWAYHLTGRRAVTWEPTRR